MMQKKSAWNKPPYILYGVCALVFLFIMIPVLIVIIISFSGTSYLKFPPSSFSFRWYQEFFSNKKWMDAALNSLKIGFGTTLVSVTLGLLAALGLTKKNLTRTKWLNVLLLTPLMVPTIIVAVALYFVFARWHLLGTFTGMIIAHSCLAIPFVTTLISSSLYGIDSRLYDAARSLGANHFNAIRLVVLPLIKPAILSSMLFAFITSFDEVIVASFITKQETTTLPKLMFDYLKFEINPVISAVSTLLIVLTTSILLFNALSQKSTMEHKF